MKECFAMVKEKHPDIEKFDIFFFLAARKINFRPIFFVRNACFYMLCEPELFADADYELLYDEFIYLLWNEEENEQKTKNYREFEKNLKNVAYVIFQNDKIYRKYAPKKYIDEFLESRREVWEMIDKYGYS